MTDTRDLSDDDALAAEYVLGSLPMADRYAADVRLKSDVRFAELVEAWEAHFAPLNDGYADVPAPNLMPAIEARLFGVKPPFWRSFWGRVTVGAAATVALLVALAITMPGMLGPTMVATLADPAYPVEFDATWHNGSLHINQTLGPVAEAGKDYELWVIAGDAAPVSLGVVTIGDDRPLAELSAGMVLAVTLEPKGGSPTGAPTGPIVAKGVVSAG